MLPGAKQAESAQSGIKKTPTNVLIKLNRSTATTTSDP